MRVREEGIEIGIRIRRTGSRGGEALTRKALKRVSETNKTLTLWMMAFLRFVPLII